MKEELLQLPRQKLIEMLKENIRKAEKEVPIINIKGLIGAH